MLYKAGPAVASSCDSRASCLVVFREARTGFPRSEMHVWYHSAWLLSLSFLLVGILGDIVAVLKPGYDGSTTCLSWCSSSAGGIRYTTCQYAFDTSSNQQADCSAMYSANYAVNIQCYCSGAVTNAALGSRHLAAAARTMSITEETTTTTTRVFNCSSVHRACTSCRNQRVVGSTRSELVCSGCASGWRLRRDGISKTCDCTPGLTLNGTGNSRSNWCAPCPVGPYCIGGSAANPSAAPTPCAEGLATRAPGAKSPAQCFTVPGYGRSSVVSDSGSMTYTAYICPRGTYNGGSNTASCQACGVGLTTVAEGSTNISACVAPPGSHMWLGTGRICPKGTYMPDFNTETKCIGCPEGLTTAGEGSNSSSQCSRVLPGYFLLDDTTAEICPAGYYQGLEGVIFDCTLCPYGYSTKQDGSTGIPDCLAPPGWELKVGAASITECELGWYKEGWNRNNCTSCGVGLTTEQLGSVADDDCRIKPGWGLKSMKPLEAVPCVNSSFGDPDMRPIQADARCVLCPVMLFTLDVLNGTTNRDGYTSELDCLLQPGYGLGPNGIVEMCQQGLYNPGFNREPCKECPAAYTSIETGTDTPDECVVQEGWALDPGSGVPQPCSAGTWSSGGTLEDQGGKCVSCPAGFTTQRDESYSPDDCNVCAAGFGGLNCTPCAYNTFSSGGQSLALGCVPCAEGTVSARGARDNTYCYPAIMQADKDIFLLSDDSYWTPDTAPSAIECEASCRANSLCAMFGFNPQSASNCQLLLESENGEQIIAFKTPKAADYALYKMPANLQVGMLLSDAGSATPQDCMKACTDMHTCELVGFSAASLPAAEGPCKLYGSVLDADYINGGYHIQGSRLFSDQYNAGP